MRVERVFGLLLAVALVGRVGHGVEAGTLPELRARVYEAEAAARAASARTDAVARDRDAAEAELMRLKKTLHEQGGWFAERSVRSQSAAVRRLVEEAIATSDQARRSSAELQARRSELRTALFAEASARTGAGDEAARAGSKEKALREYTAAAAMLAEAGSFAREQAEEPDPFGALGDAVSAADTAAAAEVYRGIADHAARRLADLVPELKAAEDACAAWERLSRYRGVLERAGGTTDPRPRRDLLRERMERGRELEAEARERARRLEAKRSVNEVSP